MSPWKVAALSAPVAWGVAAGLWTPRGPLTPAQALSSIALSAAAGWIAARANRSRWAMLIAPATFVAALELTRVGAVGPSVDAPHLSAFGLVALVTGRGVHGLLSVLPMIVGTAYATPSTRLGHLWRAGVAVLAAAVAVAVAIPGRTAPIPGPDGRPLPGSVAELVMVDAGDYELSVLIRGHDAAAPVLLFVPGSPGGMEMGSMRHQLGALERRFVVATLDRRGGGGSYGALDESPPVSAETGVADTVAVTDYLRARFHQDRIFLLAHSGGSLLGALAAARYPERYRAYIGTGQAVHLPETDRIFYDDVLAWARDTRNQRLERQLLDQGPPPYQDFYSYEPIVANTASAYPHGAAGSIGVVDTTEYPLLARAHTINSMMDTWHQQYPRMQGVDLRTDVPRLAVPAYFVQGAHEMRGLAEPFAQWYARLEAPRKRLFVFAESGHRPMFQEPDRFVDAMAEIVAES
ncbi:alpha/beta hydrolase [Asanoa sp. NPDC049518]|uniref:alpha/beta fold hydrolase n=1 Tax=unclassified Asanoa TaxID=2685164 RepID=UPI00342C8ACA